MALNSLLCADVPLRNCSLTHSQPRSPGVYWELLSSMATCWGQLSLLPSVEPSMGKRVNVGGW